MIIKDSRQYYSKNIMSYTTFITFWIVALLCTSSSGFPQGNLESESNSTTASPTTTNEMNISTTDANESTVSDTSETPISLSANDTTTTLTTEPSTSDGNSTLPETTSTIPTTLEETTEDTTTDTTEAETTETLSTTPLSPLQDTSLVFNSSQEAIATVSESMSNGISATTEVGSEVTQPPSSSISTSSTLHELEANTTLTASSTISSTHSTTESSTAAPPTTITQEEGPSTLATSVSSRKTTLSQQQPSTNTEAPATTSTKSTKTTVTKVITRTTTTTTTTTSSTTTTTAPPTTVDEEILQTSMHSVLKKPDDFSAEKVAASVKVDEKFEDLQYQIYILSGTFGIISLLLIILVIVLVTSISRLRDQVISTRHVPYIPDNRTGGDQIHAYDNSAFSSGHEMQERRRSNLDKEAQKQGYGTQNGNNSPYERHDTKSQNNRRKMESIPLDTIRQNEAESSQNKQSGDRDSKSTLMRYEDGVIPFHNDSTPNGSMKRSHQHNS